MSSTQDSAYARRLQRLSGARWKRLLNVQAPYRWRLRRYGLDRTLDVGCGIGRNLATLGPRSVGVDHNSDSVEAARRLGLSAETTEDFDHSAHAPFDALLFAHVLEHMTHAEAVDLVSGYSAMLRPAGRVLFICPQERGYASDSTHVTFVDGEDLRRIAHEAGLTPLTPTSFPFPRIMGRWFTHNESHLLSVKD